MRPGLPKHTVLYIIVYVRVCTTVLIRVHPTGKRENTSSRIIDENCSRPMVSQFSMSRVLLVIVILLCLL